jgi:hypothetical protein
MLEPDPRMRTTKEIADAVSGFYTRSIEPLAFRLRRRRLRIFGVRDDSALPVAEVDFRQGSAACGPSCASLVGLRERSFQRFRAVNSGESRAPNRCGTLAAIDLRKYRTFAEFEESLVSVRFIRDIRKARRLGYRARLFNHGGHVADTVGIRRSLKWRAFGPVLDAFFLKSNATGSGRPPPAPPTAPPCDKHWVLHLGMFLDEPGHRQGGIVLDRELVAYVRMIRTGNTLYLAEGMAHGAHLRNGVMKLMHASIVEWLLVEGGALAKGIDFLTYGAVEQGSYGLCLWKLRALFEPHLVRFSAPRAE